MSESDTQANIGYKESGAYRQGAGTAQFFFERKQGAYLDPNLLQEVEADILKSLNVRWWAERALSDIERYGEDSLAHLCLTMRENYVLYRADLTKISELRQFFETGIFRDRDKIRNFSIKSKEFTRARLAAFDDELAKNQTPSSV